MSRERIRTLGTQPKPVCRSGGKGPLLCYITDRRQFPGGAQQQRRQLLERISRWAALGVDYIQLREKDLPARELERLTADALAAIPRNANVRLLVNTRTDIALACGAQGVHLPANTISAGEVRAIWARASSPYLAPVIGVSAHSLEEILRAEAHGADFALFGPVFEKQGSKNPAGLEQLRRVCQELAIPVLALGGVTLQNAATCIAAGAAGIAGIRLFQEGEPAELSRRCELLKATG